MYCFLIFISDCEAIRKFLIGSAFEKNQYIMMNNDPNCSYNLLMGQLVLAFWEFITCLNYAEVPKDPNTPLASKPWVLADYIPTAVSPSGTSRGVPLL